MALFCLSRTTSTISTPPLRLLSHQNHLPLTIHLHRSSPNPHRFPGRCLAASPGGPPPPQPDPPTGDDPTPSESPTATLSSLQDTMQIFFAVLFWMSLFFWASAWDGRNNGRPGKGSRFRR
ncbi:hypothetical protein ACSBR2_042718 [Camellia fascicularis]